MRLGIIGTAGRMEDGPKLTLDKWNEMKRIIAKFIKDRKIVHVISGGAAFSDHLAVGLYIAHLVEKLDLALPCKFDMDNVQFFDTGEFSAWNNPGGTSNFYHKYFSRTANIDSLAQIKAAIEKGASVSIEPGFKARNSLIAQADELIAFTFGNKNVAKDGGTADTMKKYLDKGKKLCFHCDLHDMKLYENGTIP